MYGQVACSLVFADFSDFYPVFRPGIRRVQFLFNIHLFYHYASTFLCCYMLCYYRYILDNCHCNFYYIIHRYTSWYMIFAPALTMLYLAYDIWHQYLPCYTWRMISDTGTCHAIHLISDTSICHAILNTWYMTPVLDMLYLTYDTWHQYLPFYIWHMIPDIGTCHAIFDTWYMTLVFDMLYLPHDI